MWFFPKSKPRQARGGIKAQTKRGQFGTTWWAKRWIEVLESFDIGGRLERGRSYARRGQVLDINVGKGTVKAKVQGSMAKPYNVAIQVKVLPPKDWEKLTKALAREARFAARLLAGEMTQDIEDVFRQANLSLFPRKRDDLQTDCSCPDWSNPCKHVAAVYYLIGEEFDRDPFLLFRLRGLDRDELCARLGETAATDAPKEHAPLPPEPLPADAKTFWSAPRAGGDLFGDVRLPPVSAAWPKRLGNFPFWRGEERFLDALEPLYREATRRGLNVFLGDRVPT